MKKVSFAKRFCVFIKHNGRIIIGGVLIAFILFLAICAPLLTEYDPNKTDIYHKYLAPSAEHLLGTDHLGRDVWARILYGSRASLIIAFASQVLIIVFGALLGLICGFYTKADMIIMRILEAISSLPTLLTVFVISVVLGEGYVNLILAMVIGGVSGVTRYVRAQVMSFRQKEFVEREVALGAGDFRVMILHVLPQCLSYLLVTFGAGLSGKVISQATLSFLGVGLPNEVPTWGGLISAGQGFMMVHPMLVFYPIIAVAITCFGFSMLGDGLRDLLDPRTD